MHRIGLLLCWLGFIAYTWFIAPGSRGEADPVFLELMKMRSEEPSVLVMFSLLGLYPMAFATLLLRGDHTRVPAWPFSLGAFVLGAFALLPYYFLNTSYDAVRQVRTPRSIVHLISHPLFLLLLLLGTLSLIGYGVLRGDLTLFVETFMASQFVHVMTIDFVVLTLLSDYAIFVETKRLRMEAAYAWLGMLPIVGLLVYAWFSRGRVLYSANR
jgi:hypothetical protein